MSPELVLVSPPELAEFARMQLPDRPWEAFSPARPSETFARALQAATQPLVAPVVVMPRETGTGYRRGRRTAGLTLVAVVGAVALVFLPAREPVTTTSALAEPAASVRAAESRLDATANGSAIASPTGEHDTIVNPAPASTSTADSMSGAPATSSEPAPVVPSTKISGHSEAAARTSALGEATAVTGAIKGGGYIFRDGHFRVSDNGRYVIEFALRACPGVGLPPIRIGADGGFSYTWSATGFGVVRLDGRFVTPESASGTLQVNLPDCPPVQSDLSARLS